MPEPSHLPVMRGRVGDLLGPALGGPLGPSLGGAPDADPPVLLDATVGLGGHASALLSEHPALRLVGLDRDPAALAVAAERLGEFGARVTLRQVRYDRLAEVLDELGLAGVDAALFDLGVSSLQLDDPQRGFSYARDTGLDMRMGPDARLTAADVVNGYSREELARVLSEYGEERFAARIAAAIVRQRARQPLQSSAELAELVRASIPAATRRTGGHPAKRTFQALRIEVNDELGALRLALPAAVDALRVGGRIAVLAYHSLEDRIVKRVFASYTRTVEPPDLPVRAAELTPPLRLLTRGAERPTADEVEDNPRAASARLRAAERLRAAA